MYKSDDHITATDVGRSDTARAVSYLRVSTKEQAEKGGMDEGYSIPAQRDGNMRKADSIGARIIEEFVDAGESARTADRPELMRMIQYVQTHDVKYCIVHKVDRLARNRADDVAIHLALRDAGVVLVSATENIDETPSGMLLHGIMSTIAEFYSRNLATEVVKGMSQKAANGGTIGKAPVGYLNTLARDELGREVRGVVVDEERAPHVRWALRAYASGEWTISQLTDELRDRGLTTPPTPRRPSKALSTSTVHRMLTNPYYKGDVVYKGVVHAGVHEPLVEPEVWYQVQSALSAHQTAADAHSVHDHYLKGTVFCGQCGSRMMITHAKNRHSSVYPYFVCAGRHSKRTNCTRRAVLIEEVERKVEAYYDGLGLTPTQREALTGMLHREFDRLMAGQADELGALTKQRDKLEAEQLKLLEAHYADAVPLALLKKEQARLGADLDRINTRLQRHHGEYADAKSVLTRSLDLLDNLPGLYARCDDITRRLCNQALFEKIYLEDDHSLRAEHSRPLSLLLDPKVQASALAWAKEAKAAETKATKTQTPADSAFAEGLSLGQVATPTGLEPATSAVTGRRANQLRHGALLRRQL